MSSLSDSPFSITELMASSQRYQELLASIIMKNMTQTDPGFDINIFSPTTWTQIFDDFIKNIQENSQLPEIKTLLSLNKQLYQMIDSLMTNMTLSMELGTTDNVVLYLIQLLKPLVGKWHCIHIYIQFTMIY